jgi:hypothetical protein
VLVLDPKIARTHSSFYAQLDPEVKEAKVPLNQRMNDVVRRNFAKKGYPEPEKVVVVDPK